MITENETIESRLNFVWGLTVQMAAGDKEIVELINSTMQDAINELKRLNKYVENVNKSVDEINARFVSKYAIKGSNI